jgi:limonene 1,2-monooxygenase
MKFGIFAQPFHDPRENPTLAYERDLQVIEQLERLGYDEAWIGEHHSAAWETIGDPAMFLAAASQRTQRIRLGTGVVSLPYHHPFIVADRMVQLDHLSRGRVLFGVGPGALLSDAYQLGIEPTTQRGRMVESLDAILRLLRGEAVTMETDWFTLREARLQLAPRQQPHMPVFAAQSFSPSGAQAAGRFGIGMLSVATSELGGLEVMRTAWKWASEEAERHGQQISRDDWRVTMMIHLADSKREAIEDIRDGVLALNHGYYGTLGISFENGADSVDHLVDRPGVAIGTPDDAIAAIEEVIEVSGGVGGILTGHREWATSSEKMYRSYELFARYVMPRFQGQLERLEGNLDWVRERTRDIFRPARAAQRKAFEDAGMEVPESLRRRVRADTGEGLPPQSAGEENGEK